MKAALPLETPVMCGKAHETAPSDVSLEESVFFERFVSGGHCGAVKTKQSRQFAGGQEAGAVGQSTVSDTGGDLLGDLPVERNEALGVEMEFSPVHGHPTHPIYTKLDGV